MALFAIEGTPAIRAEVDRILKEEYPKAGLNAEAAQKVMDRFSARLKYYIAPDSPALKDTKNRGKNHYCQPAQASAVTGVVTEKDGKKWITATRIEPTIPDLLHAVKPPDYNRTTIHHLVGNRPQVAVQGLIADNAQDQSRTLLLKFGRPDGVGEEFEKEGRFRLRICNILRKDGVRETNPKPKQGRDAKATWRFELVLAYGGSTALGASRHHARSAGLRPGALQ